MAFAPSMNDLSQPPLGDNRNDETFAQAAEWLARLRSGNATADDRQRFAAWRRQNPEHECACRELESLWNDPALELALGQIGQPLRRRTSKTRLAWALASVCVLLLAVEPVLLSLRADYRTGVGEQQSIRLADGSTVTLDTASAIAVQFDQGDRRVRLLAGNAYFDVRHDADHPFRVEGRHGTVRIMGTRFAVAEGDTADTVTLVQGSVAVDDARGQEITRLAPNQRVILDDRGAGPVMRVDGETATAWRDGHAVFDNASLQEVVRELARYRYGTIVLADTGLADIRVSGRFRLNDTGRALASLEQTLPIRLLYATPLLVVVFPAA